MTIRVSRELYVKAPDKHTSEGRTQDYVNSTGLRRVERKTLTGESDWFVDLYERYSDDNGRTWGEWSNVYSRNFESQGEDELTLYYGIEAYNPKFKHIVSAGMRRVFIEGHRKAYEKYWGSAEAGFFDHSVVLIKKDDSEQRLIELIKYEDGGDFNPDNWRDPAYIHNNRASFGNGVDVLADGEIIFSVTPSLFYCCRVLGLEIGEVFPSCPDIQFGLMIVRGKYNPVRENYDLSFSRPVVISDLKSSRGVDEPIAVMLPTGRILAVFRGSNVQSKNWNTRIGSGAPAHKWYCYSDDGGKTFTDPVPWHFDNREVFYSSAAISAFIRSIKNDKIYWIGNISDHTAYGNHPRYPLVMAEVNEHGLLIKDTLTTIDTREEGDSEKVQLSNFHFLQDREMGTIELYLNKIMQHEDYTFYADCYRYFITVE